MNSIISIIAERFGESLLSGKRSILMLIISVGLMVIALTGLIYPIFKGTGPEDIDLIVSSMSFVGGVMLLFNYLTPVNKIKSSDIDDDVDELIKTFIHNEIIIDALKKQIPLNNQDPNVLRDLEEAVNNESVNNKITSFEQKLEILRTELLKVKREENKINVNPFVEKIRGRLIGQIDALVQRANVNLIIGVGTTIVAVLVLYFTLKDSTTSSLNESIIYFAPRLSIIILTEVFSFFFLRLYRSSYNDIKYFQNELTNVELKTMALAVAIEFDDKPTLNKVLLDLIKTERNFIIKKGESTTDLEFLKLQGQYDRSLSDNLKVIMDSVKSKAVGKSKIIKQKSSNDM